MTSGTVKFFNEAKGFGFIAPDDGGADIFVHISELTRAGVAGLNEGDRVDFEVETDRRSGKLAATNIEVTGSSGPARSRPMGGPGPRRDAPRPARGGGRVEGSGSGVVKWFNATKGFGFIQPQDGSGDIFVHVTAVERAGLSGLRDGQAVSYDLERDDRSGKTSAVNLRVSD